MFEKGELIICKPDESKIKNGGACDEFNIYAIVKDINEERDSITLEKYMRHGKLFIHTKEHKLSNMQQYYQPMKEEEKRIFYQNRGIKNAGKQNFKN